MEEAPRIAAVIATMNRAATAVACVRSLAEQSRKIELMVVADNCSTDNTVTALECLADLPFQLIVHRMKENRGNAGGVEEAMELAFANGADAVWILDDDSWPRPDAIREMLAKPWDSKVVRHPLQIDPKTGRFTWPLLVTDGVGGWKLIEDSAELPQGDFIPSRITWTGALIPREIREAVGPVLGELFIRGEDEEYPWRIEQAGFTQEAVRRAIMDHPGPAQLMQWKFFGKNFFLEPGLADWKLYYKVRNMVWLKRKQSGRWKAVEMAIAYSVAVIWFDGTWRVPLLIRAMRDGWAGRLGKMSAVN